jgi:hypothetical protein
MFGAGGTEAVLPPLWIEQLADMVVKAFTERPKR